MTRRAVAAEGYARLVRPTLSAWILIVASGAAPAAFFLATPLALAAQVEPSPRASQEAIPTFAANDIARYLAALAADSATDSASSVDPALAQLDAGTRYVAEQFGKFHLQAGLQDGGIYQEYALPGSRTSDYDSTPLYIATFVRKRGVEVLAEEGYPLRREVRLSLATDAPLVSGGVAEGSNGLYLDLALGPTRRPKPVIVAGPHTLATAANVAVRDKVVFYVPPARLDSLLERQLVDTLAHESNGVVVVADEDSARFAARQRNVRRPFPLSAWFWISSGSFLSGAQPMATNVVGVLEGSDSVLKRQYVVVTAHLTLTGSGRGTGDGTNGTGRTAQDVSPHGASGVAGLLAVAWMFTEAATRPRRSVIFVATSGADHDFAGAEFLASAVTPMSARPTDAHAVASLTLDLIGGRAGDSVVVDGLDEVEFGVPAAWVASIHAEAGLTIVGGSLGSAPCADQCAFARRKVPSLSLHDPNAGHGQRPPMSSAAVPDPDHTIRVARLAFAFVQAIANATRPVRWSAGTRERLEQRPHGH